MEEGGGDLHMNYISREHMKKKKITDVVISVYTNISIEK